MDNITKSIVDYIQKEYSIKINNRDIKKILQKNTKEKYFIKIYKDKNNVDNLFVINNNFNYNSKNIAFDFDDTLISKSNCLLPNVYETLMKYKNQGYTFVIFSNQKRIKIQTLKNRINKFLQLINIPFIAYFSLTDDNYRKPNTGMYDLFKNESKIRGDSAGIFKNILYNEEVEPKILLYVGDACGRIGDFSDSDLKFSVNCNINFKTAQEFFSIGKIITTDYLTKKVFKNSEAELTPLGVFKTNTIVFLIGYPGCGKSTVAETIYKSNSRFDIINNDTLGNNSLKVFKESLKNKHNIIIDNLNYNIKSREKFNSLIDRDYYKIVYIYFSKSYEYCMYYNLKRENIIPNVVFNNFRKNYEMPIKSEYDYIYSLI